MRNANGCHNCLCADTGPPIVNFVTCPTAKSRDFFWDYHSRLNTSDNLYNVTHNNQLKVCSQAICPMSYNLHISPEQCRAARAMLSWSQAKLARAANVSRSTVTDFERGIRIPVANNIAAIQSAFEQAGIEFLPEQESKGFGVRFRPNYRQDK